MRILWIGGSHPRHLFYINHIARDYEIAGAIIQKRGVMVPSPPDGLDFDTEWLFRRHFLDREEAERKHYGEQGYPDTDIHEVTFDTLEDQASIDFVEHIKPDLVLVFGCGMIRKGLAKVLPERTINLHLGLSPRYRGAATLFWPFYFLEPQFAGCTFHKIVHEPDAGDILHQCRPTLERGDGIHDVAAKAVIHAAGEMRRLLYNTTTWKYKKQTATGKNFLASDFKPQHLHMIYDVFNNDIVDRYLDGELPGREPNLWRSV